MPENILCPECNRYVSTTVESIKEKYPVLDDNITIKATVRRCNLCKKVIFDPILDKNNILAVFTKYRKLHNLLTHKDIISIRLGYELSLESFAILINIKDKVLKGYENGNIQKTEHDKLFRKLMDVNYFKDNCWDKRKHLLKNEYDLENAERIIQEKLKGE